MCHWNGCSFGKRTQTFNCDSAHRDALSATVSLQKTFCKMLTNFQELWWILTQLLRFTPHCSKLHLPLYISANFCHLFKNSIMNSCYWGPICSSCFPFNLSDCSLLYFLWCWKVLLQHYRHNTFVRFPLINFPWTFQHEKEKKISHFCMKNELYFLHFLRNLHSGLICATYSLWIMSKASSLSCHWGSEMFTACTLEILAA